MFPYPILSDNSEAQHSSISIYIPSAGRSFMLEFLCWSSKDIRFGAFQIALACSVICCSDFVIQERSFLIWGWIRIVRRSWIMIPICWMLLVSWWIFSNNRRRLFRSRPMDHFKLFKVFLIVSADSVYFCAFVLFWLEIRLITLIDLCVW